MFTQILRPLILLLIAIVPQCALADSRYTAPKLSVVGGFYSGTAPRKMARLQELSLSEIRDGLRWRDVQGSVGQHRFDKASAANLSLLEQLDLLGPIMVLPQIPTLNGGLTVTLPQDVRAFAHYVKATADHFPDVRIEIANEFNGGAFVSGAVRQWRPERRATLYAQMLAEIADAGVPRGRIIGGALHSMSGGYLWPLLDAGAAAHMSSVAIHPYTTAPEAFPRQMAVLRRHPEMARLGVDITEFGTRDVQGAADYFWRYYCQMALGDVGSAFWYPFDTRKDGYAPVLDHALNLTPVGQMITYATTYLAGKPVVPVRPDPFTYGCLFAGKFLVLWGAEREVRIENKELILRRGDGRPLNGPVLLSRERVVLIEGLTVDVHEDISFGPQTTLFDSYDQFRYPSGSDNSHQYQTRNGTREDFATCPGQDRPEAPWFPHLCSPEMPRTVLHDRGFVLPGKDVQFHTTFRMPHDADVIVLVALEVSQNSKDGVEVIVQVDGRERSREQISGKQSIRVGSFAAMTGAVIEVVLATGKTSSGDQGKFRMQVREATGQ